MENNPVNPTAAPEAPEPAANGAAERNGTMATPAESTTERQPAVRYMDDATFRRCLDKVVTVHDRLLAELAK